LGAPRRRLLMKTLHTRKGWDGPLTIKKICEKKEIVICDEVMWYSYVDISEIKVVEYHVGGEESVPKRFKGSR